MPHVEQCDLVLFPSNMHKQEQTNFAAQSNCNFLFRLKLDMLASFWPNLMIQWLIIIWLFTSTTPLGFIKKRGGEMSGAALKYTNDTHTHTQAPTFMLTGFMSWSVKAINKPVFPAVCLPVQAFKKNIKPQRQTGQAKEPVCL